LTRQLTAGVLFGGDSIPRQYFDEQVRDYTLAGNVELFQLLAATGVNTVPMLVTSSYYDQPKRWDLDKVDIIINLISDTDINPVSLSIVEVLTRNSARVINRAEHVRLSDRMTTASTLAAVDNLIVPQTLRINDATFERMHDAARRMVFPILVRQAGQHGGNFSGRFDSAEQLAQLKITPNRDYFLTEYRDYQSEDGLYRKCRFFFFGETLVWRHQLISENWNVHANSRGDYMALHSRAILEEKQVLADGPAALHPMTQKVLADIRRSTQTHIFGVDCAILPDNTVLLFETNPNMSFYPFSDDTQFDYNRNCITVAVQALKDTIEGVANQP
jgi:hypothetical protein